MTMIILLLRRQVLVFLLSLLSISSAYQVDSGDPSIPYNTYRLYTAKEIGSTLRQWQLTYPSFLQVLTAQQAFNLPTAGEAKDCPFDASVTGCLNYFAVLQNYVTHPEGSASSNRLPTVLLSGELHGNERVGPTSVMEAARILLEAATCESNIRYTYDNSTQFAQDQAQAIQCQDHLREVYGITNEQRQWMARLLQTRRVILVPTANALGYYRNSRYEGNIDPNRDFPYDQLTTTDCMKSIAARTLNELFRKYLIINSFTFHGGTELLGYEWGNPSWYGTVSPDDIAQDQVAQGYVQYGGSFPGSNGRNHPKYQYGDMNSIIYYVRGGFEDFAYAGSWDTERMPYCQPDTFGGYDKQKTIYDGGMLRSFNMLVETSWSKVPNDNDLGTTKNVLFENSDDGSIVWGRKRNLRGGEYYSLRTPRLKASQRLANGHIPRNLRLSIAAIDLVQPYLRVTRVNNVILSDDAVPLTEADNKHPACNRQSMSMDPTEQLLAQAVETGMVPVISTSLQSNPTIQWTVGGAITIDETDLWVAVLNDSNVLAPNGHSWLTQYICGNPFLPATSASHRLDAGVIQARFVPLGKSQSGTGFFSTTGAQPSNSNDSGLTIGPVFSTTVDLAALNVTEQTTLIIVAGAKVDNSWTELPNQPVGPANTNPQSHMVQARTNDAWFYESSDGYVIQGQSQWFSKPILLHLLDDATTDTLHHNDRTQDPSERPELKASFATEEVVVEAVVVEADLEMLTGFQEMATVAATETDVPTMGGEGTIDPTTTMDPTFLFTLAPTDEMEQNGESTIDPTTTMDPTFLFTLTPTDEMEQNDFHQSLAADVERVYNRMNKNEWGPQENPDLGGKRRQLEKKLAIQRPLRAARIPLQDLLPRP